MHPAHEELTPTEACVLLEPHAPSGRSAVRTSLLHLAAAGHLCAEVHTRRSWLDGSGGTRLARGPATGHLPDHLSVVLSALFPVSEAEARLAPTEVMYRLQRAFGYGYSHYPARHVRPLLVSRGLLIEESYRWMGIVPRRRYRCTDAGERHRDRISARLGEAEGLPELLQRDPRRAVVAAARLGGLVLIAEGLRPHLGELAGAARAEPAGTLSMVATLDEEERRTDWLEAAELLTGLDWASMLDAVSGVGDAFDAGGDAGSGDGGGDGGGGDGGGGDGGGGE